MLQSEINDKKPKKEKNNLNNVVKTRPSTRQSTAAGYGCWETDKFFTWFEHVAQEDKCSSSYAQGQKTDWLSQTLEGGKRLAS